jgi:hypothetical protein
MTEFEKKVITALKDLNANIGWLGFIIFMGSCMNSYSK